MANSEINDLTNKTTPVSTDEVEIQETAGGLSKKATVGNIAITVGSILFPVGSVYANYSSSTNPATLLGFGTWTAIEDVFIVGRGSTYAGTGGSATHTHPLSDNGQAQVEVTASGNTLIRQVTTDSWTSNERGDGTHNTDAAGRVLGAALRGSTDSGDNIPPYQAVYLWRRTA